MRFNEILHNDIFIKTLDEITQLERERKFCRHGIEHLLDVARCACIISLENKLDIDRDIIYAAALLHDIGRGEEYKNGTPHHIAGGAVAEKILDNTSYNYEEKEEILKAVTAHRTKSDVYDLAGIIYMADKLTRTCFCCAAQDECNWSDEKKNFNMRY